jgi:hypothetical protein
MPGVFADRSEGTYRYFSYNDYEERRRREWDDRQQGRTPFGPRLGAAWWPPPPSIRFAGVPAPSAEPSPQEFDFDTFRAAVNESYDAPDDAGILAVINGDQIAPTDDTWFDRLLASLPNRVGERPAFDALVYDPQVTTIDYKRAVETILQAGSG